MDIALFDKYKLATIIKEEVTKITYSSDVLKKDMQEFFHPKNTREKALLFGAFSKYHHGKIQDAFLTCQKGWLHTQEEKYKSILYLVGIIKKLK